MTDIREIHGSYSRIIDSLENWRDKQALQPHSQAGLERIINHADQVTSQLKALTEREGECPEIENPYPCHCDKPRREKSLMTIREDQKHHAFQEALSLCKPMKQGEGELLRVLSEISSMCVGEITMGYKLDAQHIGEMIAKSTGMTQPDLAERVNHSDPQPREAEFIPLVSFKGGWTCPNGCNGLVDWNTSSTVATCGTCGTKSKFFDRPVLEQDSGGLIG